MRQLAASFHLFMSSVRKEKTKQRKTQKKETHTHAKQPAASVQGARQEKKGKTTTDPKKKSFFSVILPMCLARASISALSQDLSPPSSGNFGNRRQSVGHIRELQACGRAQIAREFSGDLWCNIAHGCIYI